MASRLSLEIQCSVCLGDYNDPVILPCDHSFCRACISGHINASMGPILCPECREPFASTEIRVSRLLRNLTLTVRGHLEAPGGQASLQRAPGPQGDLVCGEHDEKLKLFCVTDQRLACTICKEQDKHRGHTFKPVKEAADNNKGVLKGALGFIMKENQSLHDLSERQLSEIDKCEKRSAALKAQFSAQFEALHQFLHKRERELHQELEKKRSKSVAAMQRNLSTIQGKAADGQEMELVLRTALDIPKADHYLQWWQSKGYPITEGMKERRWDGQIKFKSNVKTLVVTPDSVSMGPYESHLLFFVWKEMLQTIKPGPERLIIKEPGDSYLKVSPEGHSIRQVDRSGSMYKTYNPSASTAQTFKTGRHYCELEVGGKQNWSIGLKVDLTKGANLELPEKEIQLHLKNGGYVFSHDGTEHPVSNVSKSLPRRIGLYLDCEGQQVSFYNTDTMSLIHSSFCSFLQPCSISVCPGLYMDGKNTDPLTFYWL